MPCIITRSVMFTIQLSLEVCQSLVICHLSQKSRLVLQTNKLEGLMRKQMPAVEDSYISAHKPMPHIRIADL